MPTIVLTSSVVYENLGDGAVVYSGGSFIGYGRGSLKSIPSLEIRAVISIFVSGEKGNLNFEKEQRFG